MSDAKTWLRLQVDHRVMIHGFDPVEGAGYTLWIDDVAQRSLSLIAELEAQVADWKVTYENERRAYLECLKERDALRADVARLERGKAALLDRITNTDAIQIVSLKQTVARLERENAELRKNYNELSRTEYASYAPCECGHLFEQHVPHPTQNIYACPVDECDCVGFEPAQQAQQEPTP